METTSTPNSFIFRRLHSLMGLWLVIFLSQHLLVNSQAALFFGEDGKGFIHAANALESLPYLPLLEFIVLALPLLIHTLFGIQYVFQAKYNAYTSTGKDPYLPLKRNRAYTWQRITSWILVVGILAHVVHMRFIERPSFAQQGAEKFYITKVEKDEGLYTLADRLNVDLLNYSAIQKIQANNPLNSHSESNVDKQHYLQQQEIIKLLDSYKLKDDDLLTVSNNFGTAELLMVRNTFKNPIMMVLYTLFVLTACYHAFNGLWTFLISWGVIQSEKSQKLFLKICHGLMVIVSLLGLSAIWLTYWINLKQ